jgi:hypothetical protein
MSSTETETISVLPTSKTPIPPPYQGLAEAATFGRLASRPDRIDPVAVSFFYAWLVNTNFAVKGKDGRISLRPEFVPIGKAGLFNEDSFADVTSGSSSTGSTAAATTKK